MSGARRGALALAGLLVALGGLSGSPAWAQGGRSCVPAGSKTLASSGSVRVYRRGTTVFACMRGRRVRLGRGRVSGPDTEGPTVARPRIAGRYVAFERRHVDDANDRFEVLVVDVRRRRVVTRVPTGEAPPDVAEAVGVGPVRRLELRRDGAVAWIAADESNLGEREVWTACRNRATPVAAGADVEEAGLALRASAVAYRQAGADRSAPAPACR